MVVFGFGLVALGIWAAMEEQKKVAQMSPEQLAEYRKTQAEQSATALHGPKNPQLICPHCQTKGSVRTKLVVQKKGISGGKATAALLTAGTSILLTGLSRKEDATQAHCDNCNCSWVF